MAEFLEAGGGVPFAEIAVYRFVKLPAGCLAEFVPSDAAILEATVGETFAQHDVEDFLSLELGTSYVPWAEGLHVEEVGKVQDLARGFSSKLGFLKQVELATSSSAGEGVIEAQTPQFVRDAVAIYQEMLSLAAKKNGWSEEQAMQQQSVLLAQLSMPDAKARARAWSFWNGLAADYTQRKVQRLRGVLQQPAA